MCDGGGADGERSETRHRQAGTLSRFPDSEGHVPAGVAAGVGIAFCLGGAMHYVDLAIDPESTARLAWPFRALLVFKKRLHIYRNMGEHWSLTRAFI